jgi:hypothetical protein
MPKLNDEDKPKENASEHDAKHLRASTKESRDASYLARYKEIESLRLYSRGEKHIEPVDLKKYIRDELFD